MRLTKIFFFFFFRSYCEMLTVTFGDLSLPDLFHLTIMKTICVKTHPEVKNLLSGLSKVSRRFKERLENQNPSMMTLEEQEVAEKLSKNIRTLKDRIWPLMKDLYTVHADKGDHLAYAEHVVEFAASLDSVDGFIGDEVIRHLLSSLTVHSRITEEIIHHPSFKVRLSSMPGDAIAGWIKCAILFPIRENHAGAVGTSALGSIVSEDLLIRDSSTEELFAVIGREANTSEKKKRQFQGIFGKAFDLYKQFLSKHMDEFVSDQSRFYQIYQLGGSMVQHLSHLMYSPLDNLNKIENILNLLYVSSCGKKSVMTSYHKQAVLSSLPKALEGISSLPGVCKDPALIRIIANILWTHLSQFRMDRGHPIILSMIKSYDLTHVILKSCLRKLQSNQEQKIILDLTVITSEFNPSAVTAGILLEILNKLVTHLDQHITLLEKIFANLRSEVKNPKLNEVLSDFMKRNINFNKDGVFRIVLMIGNHIPHFTMGLIPILEDLATRESYKPELLLKRISEVKSVIARKL